MPQPTGSNVLSVAGFWTDTFTQSDPLLASECISQGVKVAGSLGILKRGTVLYGPAPGTPITAATILTTVVTGNTARVILAQDLDTGAAGQVNGLAYTQGKFLDTGMIFGANGAASDAAQLWQFGIYVLTVLQASGKLVPMISLPATGGPLAASMTSEEAAKANQEQIDAIKAAIDVFQPGVEEVPIGRRGQDPAWATAAFGEREPSKEETALDKATDHDIELRRKHQKAVEDLQAKQAKELHELHRKQHEERAKGNGPTPPAPKKS
jgi:hypothetical protein